MSSEAGPSRRSHSELFPRAALRIVSSKGVEKKSCDVVLAVSHRVYWKVVSGDDASMPKSLFDFRNASSLELIRLDATASWDDVVERVKPHESDVTSLTIRGRLHGRARLASLNSDVKLVLSAPNEEQRDKWVHELRLRVAPPELLHERARELVADDTSDAMSVDELTRRMNALLVGEVGEHRVVDISGEARPSKTDDGRPGGVPGRPALHERLNKWDWVEKLNSHLSNLTGIVAKAIKVGSGKDSEGANTAQLVADFSKIIPGVASSIFHLVVLGARLASMFAEASRGRKELPGFLVKVGELLECVTESVVPILQSPASQEKGELLMESNVFEVLGTIFDMMGEVEQQLLRSWQGQLFNADVLKRVESKLGMLKMKVVDVVLAKNVHVNAEDIRGLKRKWNAFENSNPNPLLGLLPVRPRKSAYFVGRTNELRQLKEIVREHGSAAITGFGGLGKTQLMTAFAGEAQDSRDVPGGLFWVTADGDASEVVEALAVFVETLKGATIPEIERRKSEVVLARLKDVLNEASGRWLLCLDNVDGAVDSNVCGILDEVAGIAEPAKDNGWVVVTSRCGQPKLWNSMAKDQNVVLSPLSEEEGMYVLWRYKNSKRYDQATDETIAGALIQFKSENEYEYDALRELCGYGWNRSLAGLPLALIHAGSYICQFECSFSKYLELYRNSDGKSDLEDILQKAQDVALKPEQRAILTTWSISMRRLSEEARQIIRAVAMLGNAPIPEGLMKETLKESGGNEGNATPSRIERRFHKLVLGELVFGSSLLRRYRNESETTFEVHRLVRMFILVDMEQDRIMQEAAFGIAARATHTCVDSALKEQKKYFYSWPNSRADNQFRYFPHSLAIVNAFISSSISVDELSTVAQLCEFSGACLYWIGRLNEAVNVQKNLLKFQLRIHGMNTMHDETARTIHQLGNTYQAQGKLSEAEGKYRKSLDMKYSIHGRHTNHRGIATSLLQLGIVYRRQGKLREAEDMNRRSLDMNYSIYGQHANHSRIAISLHQLGNVCRAQEKLSEAEDMYRKSLDMNYSIHGRHANHSDIAVSLHQLGNVYQAQGKLGEAEDMYQKSLYMAYSIYGRHANHSLIAVSLHQLGNVYQAQGKLGEAEDMYQKSLDMEYSIHGRNASHRHISVSLHQLGNVYQAQGKLSEAEDIYQKSLEMFHSIYGRLANHDDIASLLHQLGIVYRAQGKLGEAEATLDRDITNLGAFKNHGKLSEAEDKYRKSLDNKNSVLR